ncbi:MAG: radical SAM protein [Bacillota bacterium]
MTVALNDWLRQWMNNRAITIMIKPASSGCNLQCEYCFYNATASSRKISNQGIMSKETAHNLIDKAVEYVGQGCINFVFQGGEPLLVGIDFYEDFVSYFNKIKGRARVNFSLQTNGTLLNDDYCKFFNRHNFLLGVSLDGSQATNKYRKLQSGEPSFDAIIKGINLLKKHNVQFNILSVVTKNSAKMIKRDYKFFAENDMKYLQFIPCLKPICGEFDSNIHMTANEYGKFLYDLFQLYVADNFKNNKFVSIRYFDNLLNLITTGRSEQCGVNGQCGSQYVIEGGGNIYPCDFYCEDKWLLGNINNTDFATLEYKDLRIEFLAESSKIPQKCIDCQFFALCKSCGCKRSRAHFEDYCGGYYRFFSKILPQLEDLKRLIVNK